MCIIMLVYKKQPIRCMYGFVFHTYIYIFCSFYASTHVLTKRRKKNSFRTSKQMISSLDCVLPTVFFFSSQTLFVRETGDIFHHKKHIRKKSKTNNYIFIKLCAVYSLVFFNVSHTWYLSVCAFVTNFEMIKSFLQYRSKFLFINSIIHS